MRGNETIEGRGLSYTAELSRFTIPMRGNEKTIGFDHWQATEMVYDPHEG